MPRPPVVNPIPIKARTAYLHIGKGQVDVRDGAFAVIDKNGTRTLIPVGGVVCLFLEPGIRISHRAVKLAADAGTLLIWTGEAGVRFYAAGQPGGARAERLLWQAALALDPQCRLRIVRHMFDLRFGVQAPTRRSIEQLRGMEGARVRQLYQQLAEAHGLEWTGRKYERNDWQCADPINRAISAANACLYGITEAAILAAGYSPSIGFLHTGKARSFVYDIADLFKFDVAIPIAFEIAKEGSKNISREVRLRCRDSFKDARLLGRIIPAIHDVLETGGSPTRIVMPESWHPPAFAGPQGLADPGHRQR